MIDCRRSFLCVLCVFAVDFISARWIEMTAPNVPQSTNKPLHRRQFLGLAWAAASLALFGQAAVALCQFLKPATQEGAFGGKVVAGNIKEFPVGTVSSVRSMHGFVSRVSQEG